MLAYDKSHLHGDDSKDYHATVQAFQRVISEQEREAAAAEADAAQDAARDAVAARLADAAREQGVS